MNYYHYGLILLLIVISFFVLGYMSFSNKNEASPVANDIKSTDVLKKIKIKDAEYEIEIADNFAAREKGLMNRKSMPENHGMLFVFDQVSYHGFWMKNTLIPLDMIWLNSKGEVVYIYENAQPCSNLIQAVCSSIIPTKAAKYVLELNAGQVKKLGLSAGDSIQL